MGYDHSIDGAIFITPPIPADQVPADHPLNPHHHPWCRDRYTGAPVPPTVQGHQRCTRGPDLMFRLDDAGAAAAIVPATDLGRKLGAPVRVLGDALAAFGAGRVFEGELEFTGDGGETWTLAVEGGRVHTSEGEEEGC